MIHVLEFPRQRRPHAWFAFDVADLVRKIAASHQSRVVTIPADPEAALEFWLTALRAPLEGCKVLWNDDEALEALESQNAFSGSAGEWAREALRDQMIALELIEGV